MLCVVFPHIHFCVFSNCFSFGNLITLGLWLCIPFRRVVHNSSWIWYWKKLVQRPVLCLLAATLTNEVFDHLSVPRQIKAFSVIIWYQLLFFAMDLENEAALPVSVTSQLLHGEVAVLCSGTCREAVGELLAVLAPVSHWACLSRAGGYNRGELEDDC